MFGVENVGLTAGEEAVWAEDFKAQDPQLLYLESCMVAMIFSRRVKIVLWDGRQKRHMKCGLNDGMLKVWPSREGNISFRQLLWPSTSVLERAWGSYGGCFQRM